MIKSAGITERTCTKKDYAFCYSITKRTIFPYISQFVKADKKKFDADFYARHHLMKILSVGKRRIGLYQIVKDDHEKDALYISRIFLIPSYQGKGIGRALMEHFETLGGKNIKKLKLSVWEGNPAIKFYKKLGYKVTSKNAHKYHMEKMLKKKKS